MNKKLMKLANWLQARNYSVEYVPFEARQNGSCPRDEQLLVKCPQPLGDYGLSVILSCNGFAVVVWESYAATSLGSMWTKHPHEIALFASIKINSFEAQFNEVYSQGEI